MSHWISIFDQYLRFLQIILPQIGSDFRHALPGIDPSNTTLTSRDHISSVENVIDVEYVDNRLRGLYVITEQIQYFIRFLSDRPDKRKITVIVGENGSYVGSILQEFGHIMRTGENVEIGNGWKIYE